MYKSKYQKTNLRNPKRINPNPNLKPPTPISIFSLFLFLVFFFFFFFDGSSLICSYL